MARRPATSVTNHDWEVRVFGAEEIARRLKSLPPALIAALDKVLEAQAHKMAAHMRAIAPRDDRGRLAANIRVERRRPLVWAVIADAVDDDGHAFPAHVEYGHRTKTGQHISAKPFFWPTLRVGRKRLRGAITRAANKTIKDLAG